MLYVKKSVLPRYPDQSGCDELQSWDFRYITFTVDVNYTAFISLYRRKCVVLVFQYRFRGLYKNDLTNTNLLWILVLVRYNKNCKRMDLGPKMIQ